MMLRFRTACYRMVARTQAACDNLGQAMKLAFDRRARLMASTKAIDAR